MRVIEIDKPIAEMVKGSLEYAQDAVRRAFYAQFRHGDPTDMPAPVKLGLLDTFADYVIAVEFEDDKPDHYYRAPFTQDGDEITFAPRAEWEPVELAYTPRTEPEAPEEPPAETDMTLGMMGGESQADAEPETLPLPEAGAPAPRKPGGKQLNEDRIGGLTLIESAGGPKRIKAIGITAGVVNGNRRRYAAEVLRAAVADMRQHLHESAGQGRAIYLLGEAEHPESKARRPSVREVVVKWDDARFNESTGQVELDGHLIETAAGKDIRALLEGGVMPGISQRARGRSHFVDENGERIEEVTELTITGYDLVMEPSDPFAGVTMTEELQADADGADAAPTEDEDMTPEQLAEMIRQQPDLFKGLVAEEVKTMTEAQRAELEKTLRAKLGIPEDADLFAELTEAVKARKELAETKQRKAVADAITEQTKSLPYGDKLNKLFCEAVKDSAPATVEAVTALVAQKRKEYDALVASNILRSMGRVDVLGPVIETQTNGDWPEYARHAFEFNEALVRRGDVQAWSPAKPKNQNEVVAAAVLKRFDEHFKGDLLREARLFDEAETAASLSLPYGVSRAILSAVFPTLVATGLFDVGVTDQSPLYIYYESYSDETGKYVTVTNEDVVADLDAWVSLAHKRIRPGTVVVTTNGGSTPSVEGTDFILDYTNGALMALTGGNMSDGTTYDVDYSYDAIRAGEGSAIQEGKGALARALMDIQADRLATQITDEAIKFSRSQLGWDATARTLMMLVTETRRRIDGNLMYDALSASLGVASNTGGAWNSASDSIQKFVDYLGVAKDKILKRYYEPTGILMSSTRADAVANWDNFTAAGKRPDADLNANGYIGRLKGLPVFTSTEFSDAYALVFNRQHLFHRIYEPMNLEGPHQSYSNGKLVDAKQWFAREYNGTLVPLRNKASYVSIS